MLWPGHRSCGQATGAVARPLSRRSPPSAPQNVIPVSTLEHLADERFVACCIRTSREPMRTSMRTSPTQLQTSRAPAPWLQTALATGLPKASQRPPRASPRTPRASKRLPRASERHPRASQGLPKASKGLLKASKGLPKGLPKASKASQRIQDFPTDIPQPIKGGRWQWRMPSI